MVKVKFCGIRRPQDIQFVNQTRPDYIGFVFAESRRKVSVEEAVSLTKDLNPQIQTVGVFVNEPLDALQAIVQQVRLHVIQLHGDEDAEYLAQVRKRCPETEIWKAVRVRGAEAIQASNALDADKLLLDSFVPGQYGGSGKVANWSAIHPEEMQKPFFLAGGLTAENLQEALSAVSPWGVDISGGIETDGLKDLVKMQTILQILRKYSPESAGFPDMIPYESEGILE